MMQETWRVFKNGISFENPLTVLMIGLCSTLAVSATFQGSLEAVRKGGRVVCGGRRSGQRQIIGHLDQEAILQTDIRNSNFPDFCFAGNHMQHNCRRQDNVCAVGT